MNVDKGEIRRRVRAAVSRLSQSERDAQAEYICRHIVEHESVQRARVVAAFCSLPDEPSTARLLRLLSSSHTVVVPRIQGDDMEFCVYRPEETVTGAFGIEEPQGDDIVPPHMIDTMIVPGVAFTPAGHRMGRGKGFYDRYMAQPGFNACKIGVCYNVQMLAALPVERHDIPMNDVVSPPPDALNDF